MTSPTTHSLALLKKEGYTAQVVERFNMFAKIRIDLFGFIDICALENLKEGKTTSGGVLGIQTTSTGNINARIKKILAIPTAKLWLICGNRIAVHGWSKKGPAGKRKTYQVKVVEITLKDFKND